jgi:limonene-1,2-epoxide hydrolase
VTDTSVYVEGSSDQEQIVGTEIERIALDFVHAAYGEHMDVEAMSALMSDDFLWQLNVPLSPDHPRT